MRAVVIERPHQWQVTDVPDPTPQDDEVIVSVSACGVAAQTCTFLRAISRPTCPSSLDMSLPAKLWKLAGKSGLSR